MSSCFPVLTYRQMLGGLLTLAVILAAGLSPMQGDTWWQLRAGRDMWQSGRVLLEDTYSFTSTGAYWPNHEWLAEVFYYGAYRIGGPAVVTLAAALLIAAGWLASWAMTRGRPAIAFVLMAAALVPSSVWWEPRPHAFSLACLPLAVWLVSGRRYAWLPLVFAVWANAHGGVVLGLVGLTAALASGLTRDSRDRRTIVLAWMASVATTLVTPLGWRFWISIPESLARIRLYPLDEWRRTPLFEPQMLPYWIVAPLFVWALVRVYVRHGRDRPVWNEPACACAAVLLVPSLTSIRHVGPFLMVAVPAVTTLLASGGGGDAVGQARRWRNDITFGVAASLVGCALVVLNLHPAPRLKREPMTRGAVAALENCPGNLYNRYDEGGQILWFVPGRRVFIDGRQDPYPVPFVLDHIRMETEGGDDDGVFARYDIACAYLPSYSPTARRLRRTGWKTLQSANDWLVLGRDPADSTAN